MNARRILALSSIASLLALSAAACSNGNDGARGAHGEIGHDAAAPNGEPAPDPEDPTEEEPVPMRETVCDDGVDDDGDGRIDCADDDCATEPRCVEDGTNCANGLDDDGDGLVDCADPDCEAVIDATLEGPLPIEVRGDTTGQGNDYVLGPPTCSESPVNRGDDVAYSFTAPEAGTYRFTSFTSEEDPFGIVLRIARPECGAPEIACQAYDVAPGVDVSLGAGQAVIVVVDPFTTGTATGGPYVLRVERAP